MIIPGSIEEKKYIESLVAKYGYSLGGKIDNYRIYKESKG